MACKPVSAPAAVCQAALANCTSHHKHTQPEALSSLAILPLWWKYSAELRAVATKPWTSASTCDTNTEANTRVLPAFW